MGVEDDLHNARPCIPEMLQPICKPFACEGICFEILPYALPTNEPQASGAANGDSLAKLKLSTQSRKFISSYNTPKEENRAVLLTGDQIHIDPGELKPIRTQPSQEIPLEAFWHADPKSPDTDPLIKAQHRHLKELSKQVGYELKYGEWPKGLPITEAKFKETVKGALERHATERDEDGNRRPLCKIVRESIARDPMQERAMSKE
jgi:hypothetical protein